MDDKPVLMVYGPKEVFSRVQQVWRMECANVGIPDLFLIHKTIPGSGESFFEDVKVLSGWDGVFDFPPTGVIYKNEGNGIYNICDYTSAIVCSLFRETGKRFFHSVYCCWDNSPRKGENGSYIVKNSSPDLFSLWLELATSISSEEIVFINAWNEWGESAALEPSTIHGYDNLKALMANPSLDAWNEMQGVSCYWLGDRERQLGNLEKAKSIWRKGIGNSDCINSLSQ